ncbi:jg9662 [Pararge aegeria aegeria]|uniref:Jg9662 protein n=2 Tax=Pararge aegeria TaxID=116150 RepID=A0A8S4RVI0_9NEOP|nr:jg9662 [Pararge aegeria aegeria]
MECAAARNCATLALRQPIHHIHVYYYSTSNIDSQIYPEAETRRLGTIYTYIHTPRSAQHRVQTGASGQPPTRPLNICYITNNNMQWDQRHPRSPCPAQQALPLLQLLQ